MSIARKLNEYLKKTYLPNTKETNEQVVRETASQHLGHDEHVGSESGLQHDGHVGGVEELDGVRTALATEAVRLDGNFDAEALEVDDHGEHDDGGNEVHDVGETLPPEGLAKSTTLVVPGEDEVEERDDGALELGSTASVDGCRGEGLPDDGLANVGRNKERDTGAETVALLEELIEEDDDEGSGDELDDEQEADTGAEVAGLAVETSEDVDRALTECDDQCKHYGGEENASEQNVWS